MQDCKNLLANLNKQTFLAMLLLFKLIPSNGQGKQKCFEDDGLKYRTVITINFLTATQVNGVVTSTEYDSDVKEKTDFAGTISGKMLNIKFKGKPPIIGAATQWTSKPWLIKKIVKKKRSVLFFTVKIMTPKNGVLQLINLRLANNKIS